MPRYTGMVMKGDPAAYHVMSLTALSGYPFSDADKDEFVSILKN